MAQDPQGYGKVLSTGENVPDTVKKGDVLVFHTRAGMDLIQKKIVLKCLKYDEIYGILEDEELIERLQPLKLEPKSEEKSNIIKPRGGGIVVA